MDNNIEIGSNRSFGIVFSIFFLLIFLFPFYSGGSLTIIPLIISLVFLILGLINSKILSPLNFIWFKIGILLGKFVSPIIMGLVYFIVVTPTGMIMRFLNKDLLNLKRKKNKTYWIERNKSKSDMKNQF